MDISQLKEPPNPLDGPSSQLSTSRRIVLNKKSLQSPKIEQTKKLTMDIHDITNNRNQQLIGIESNNATVVEQAK